MSKLETNAYLFNSNLYNVLNGERVTENTVLQNNQQDFQQQQSGFEFSLKASIVMSYNVSQEQVSALNNIFASNFNTVDASLANSLDIPGDSVTLDASVTYAETKGMRNLLCPMMDIKTKTDVQVDQQILKDFVASCDDIKNADIKFSPEEEKILQTCEGYSDYDQLSSAIDPMIKNAIQAGVTQLEPGARSLDELVTVLMLMMIQNALQNKSMQRMFKAELASSMFQNGLKMAELTREQAGLKLASVCTNAALSITGTVAGMAAYGIGTRSSRMKGSDTEKMVQSQRMNFLQQSISTTIGNIGNVASGVLDFQASMRDATKQCIDALNRLTESWISSADMDMRTQDQAIEFSKQMLQKIYDLANQARMSIINHT